MDRLRQLKEAFDLTRAQDSKLVPLMLVAGLAGFGVFFSLGFFLINSLIFGIILGVLALPVASTVMFGRRATKTQYSMLRGQPGAPAAIVQSMRGFLVTPAIAFNKKQDMVHLVVSRSGVVLLGEGRRQGVSILLKQETAKVKRAAGDVPVHQVSVGDGEGQVDLDDLRMHLMKMKRSISKPQMYDLHQKLEAIAKKFQPKMPGGPIPTKRPKMR